MSRRNMLFTLFLFISLMAASFVIYRYNNFRTEKAVLEGVVLKAGLVKSGEQVEAGDVLVKIDGLVGPVPASRATINGQVVRVYVKQGDTIKPNQPVALIKKEK